MVAGNAVMSAAANVGVNADSAFNNRDNVLAVKSAADQHVIRIYAPSSYCLQLMLLFLL
jgi:hypothetical protein